MVTDQRAAAEDDVLSDARPRPDDHAGPHHRAPAHRAARRDVRARVDQCSRVPADAPQARRQLATVRVARSDQCEPGVGGCLLEPGHGVPVDRLADARAVVGLEQPGHPKPRINDEVRDLGRERARTDHVDVARGHAVTRLP